MQLAWAEAQERGEPVVWTGGRASGRSFVFNLYAEYRGKRGPEPPDSCPECGKPVLVTLDKRDWACIDADCVHGHGHESLRRTTHGE
jgi:hypothetical protein